KFFYSLSVPGVIPIAFGTNRSDYEAVAPPESFIHVTDFSSHKELAEYLSRLSSNEKEFNSYHEWRRSYELDVPYFRAQCDFCKALNQRKLHGSPKPIHDLNEYWSMGKCFN
ncbi:Uncharacterized protein FKW44_013674, partial [Caligus rogercresseyi]